MPLIVEVMVKVHVQGAKQLNMKRGGGLERQGEAARAIVKVNR